MNKELRSVVQNAFAELIGTHEKTEVEQDIRIASAVFDELARSHKQGFREGVSAVIGHLGQQMRAAETLERKVAIANLIGSIGQSDLVA